MVAEVSLKKVKSHAINHNFEAEGGNSESSSEEDWEDSNNETDEPRVYVDSDDDQNDPKLSSYKTLESKLSGILIEEEEDPLDNIKNVCQSILEISKSLDIEIQKKKLE